MPAGPSDRPLDPDPERSPSDAGGISNFRFICEEGDGDFRLDLFLVSKLPEFSRSQIKRLILLGRVKHNGKTPKAGAVIRPGDAIEVAVPAPEPSSIVPESIPLGILYEDESLLVIDKPPGLVVHPAPGHYTGTLVHALLAHCPGIDTVGGPARAGLVHRLDMDTSGVMVVAKTDRAHRNLTRQFKDREVHKCYLTLVLGVPESDGGEIDLPLGRDVKDRKKISVRTKSPRTALTRWQVLRRFRHCAYLRVRPQTGRTHQIRVHLAAVGHPVAGDRLYGRKTQIRQFANHEERDALLAVERQFLHAESIDLMHPETLEKIHFRAPLASDLVKILNTLQTCERQDTPKI